MTPTDLPVRAARGRGRRPMAAPSRLSGTRFRPFGVYTLVRFSALRAAKRPRLKVAEWLMALS